MIDFLFRIRKAVIVVLLALLASGVASYRSIPKESAPEVPIPMIYVVSSLSGISPEDAQRLIVKPLEAELTAIQGLKEIKATSHEGSASLILEFDAGFDADQALQDVKDAVDSAKPDLPDDATDPIVQEINTSEFPILSVLISGAVPERLLMTTADRLADELEKLPGVLEADVTGLRDETLELQISREKLAEYDLQISDVLSRVQRNNQLVSAGTLRTDGADFKIKVPGLIQTPKDLMGLPLKEVDGTIVPLSELASVRQTYKDANSASRLNGDTAISIEIKKKSGANIIETAELVRSTTLQATQHFPDGVSVRFMQDESEQTKEMLSTLESNVIAAVLLVMIVILWSMGPVNAILVGLSIPGAFLAGVLALHAMGYTMNIVVLFALILVVGMLVDGSIVTVEYADNKLSQGAKPIVAFKEASKRMFWPITASTATTLCVFLPLLFWDQTIGEFMKYLPITVLLTLSASLAMALVFIPILGSILSKRRTKADTNTTKAVPYVYDKALVWATHNPLSVFLLGVTIFIGSIGLYGKSGSGVTFFPDVEPEFIQVTVKNTDGLPWAKKLELMSQIEQRLPNSDAFKAFYTKITESGEAGSVGSIQIELADWDQRPTVADISDELRASLSSIPGTKIEIGKPAMGPTSAKPVSLIAYIAPDAQSGPVVGEIVERMNSIGGFLDITSDLPVAGIDWKISIDKQKAATLGADTTLLGQFVQLLTNGVKISDYRPSGSNDSVDILIRLPAAERTFENLKDMRVPTAKGYIPASEFISIEPTPGTGYIKTIDGKRAVSIASDLEQGALAGDLLQKLTNNVISNPINGLENLRLAGDAEEQAGAMAFLGIAFLVAILMMFLILLVQFNSLGQTLIVLSAIIFSISGVLIGLVATSTPFMVVMSGIGVIALAGIVVNNNIVFIDAYNELRASGMPPIEAAITSGRTRFRPVMLTSVTTILGLLPMVLGMSLDFVQGTTQFGAPATQWWVELSTTIAGGMTFATMLTLIMTPALLVGLEHMKRYRLRRLILLVKLRLAKRAA